MSPAVAKYLGIESTAITSWRFVDDDDVQPGMWLRYNEQAILHAAVVDVRERLKPLGWSYEIILAENGTKDRTIELGNEIAAK